jgi:hypothetical protein
MPDPKSHRAKPVIRPDMPTRWAGPEAYRAKPAIQLPDETGHGSRPAGRPRPAGTPKVLRDPQPPSTTDE